MIYRSTTCFSPTQHSYFSARGSRLARFFKGFVVRPRAGGVMHADVIQASVVTSPSSRQSCSFDHFLEGPFQTDSTTPPSLHQVVTARKTCAGCYRWHFLWVDGRGTERPLCSCLARESSSCGYFYYAFAKEEVLDPGPVADTMPSRPPAWWYAERYPAEDVCQHIQNVAALSHSASSSHSKFHV